MRAVYLRLTVTALILVLAGCAGVKTYPNTLDKNLRVHTKAKSDALLTRLRVDIDIFDVVGDCRIEYVGSLKLDQPNVDVGLAVNKPSYLSIVFTRNSIGSRSTYTYETVLTPRAQHVYSVDVSHLEGMYEIFLRERGTAKNSPVRELARQPLTNCK